MKYRIDVAMSGRLGMEIQPKNMSDDEKTLYRNEPEWSKKNDWSSRVLLLEAE